MARAVLECELIPASTGRLRFALAAEADDAEIRRLFRENPMAGRISLSFEHEPNWFSDASLPEQTKQTIVAREAGRVVCAGFCSIRRRFVNGAPRRVGYLGGLRLCSRQAGRFDILRRGYEFFRTLQSDNPADFYFTSIATDNHVARRFLERGLPGMPAYEFIGEFVTVLLPAQNRPPGPNSETVPVPAKNELITVFNEHGCRQQFTPHWSNAELTALNPLGLRESDFRFIHRRGQVVACAALWDQRAFKQTVVRGYAPGLALARPALNLASRIVGGTRLPAVGQTLANAFVSHLNVAPDEPDALIALTAELRSLAAQRQIEILTLGFAANDSRLATIRQSFRVREYHSRLYVVRWPETGGAARGLGCPDFGPGNGFAMNNSLGIQFRLVPRAELTPAQKGEMFQLMAQHFDGVTPEQFARDLAEKNLALLLERHETLVGFSTLLAYATMMEKKPVNVIYSGDTIVSPAAWGTTALPRAWVAGVEALRATLPPGRCFWLLLTSGFRTYRFLPVFWREFFPRFDAVTPPDKQLLLNQLAQERFGAEFDSATGIVRFVHPQRLRTGLKEIPPCRENDPHVTFFMSQNPGHVNGDELVCLAELCPENLTRAGRRMMAPQACATHCDHR